MHTLWVADRKKELFKECKRDSLKMLTCICSTTTCDTWTSLPSWPCPCPQGGPAGLDERWAGCAGWSTSPTSTPRRCRSCCEGHRLSQGMRRRGKCHGSRQRPRKDSAVVSGVCLSLKMLRLPRRCASSRLVDNKHFIEIMALESSISIKKSWRYQDIPNEDIPKVFLPKGFIPNSEIPNILFSRRYFFHKILLWKYQIRESAHSLSLSAAAASWSVGKRSSSDQCDRLGS